MAKEIYSLSLDSIKLLCGLIRDLASVSDGILDTAICTDKTFSSYYIDLLLKQLKADSEAYTDEVASALTKLTAEVVTVEPTLDNTTNKINTILLYSPNGNDVYDQYLRLETQLISLGSTQISMADYIKTSEADNKYSTKTELKAVTDKIGTTALTTTAQTLTGSIEEVKGIAEQGTMLTVTKTQYDQLVAGGTVSIGGKDYTYDDNTYYVVKDDSDTITTTTTINASSTDSEVPTAKAVNVECKYGRVINNDVIATYGTEISKYPVGKWVIYRNDMAVQFTDLPTKTACRINIYGLLDNNFTPFNNSWQYRMINVIDISGKSYTREFNSGNTAGVFEYDSGWQRVVTTKVDDVPITAITWASSSIISGGVANYEIRNGICYVYFRGNLIVQSEHANGTVLATGFPKPTVDGFYMTGIWNLSTSILLQVNAKGELVIWSDSTNNGKNIHFSFSYPVAES